MKIRVYYEDTDAGGIVYHSKYINFCERARSELLFKNGLSPKKNNSFFIVRDLNARFYKSALLGEMLEVITKIDKINKVSMELMQEIYNEKRTLLFRMNIKLVYIKNSKPFKMDEDIVAILKTYFDDK